LASDLKIALPVNNVVTSRKFARVLFYLRVNGGHGAEGHTDDL